METLTRERNDEIEIDLSELLGLLWSHALQIALTAVVVALAAYLAIFFVMPKQYVSYTKLYVLAKSGDANNVTTSELQAGTLLTSDYVELVKSRKVTETVINQLGLKDSKGNYISSAALADKISASVKEGTRVLTISVKDTDPYMAHDIAEAVRVAAAEHIREVMDFEAVNVVDEANVPLAAASPARMRLSILAGIAAAFLAIAIILILHFSDDSIKTEDDIERYLGVSTLGMIPMTGTEKKTKKKTRRRKARR